MDTSSNVSMVVESQPIKGSRLSIAMAIYNGARYLDEQLASLSRQTYLPCELVITDDGSTDDSLRIVNSFAQTAPFPVRISQNEERLGYGANFLRAASLCHGDFIAFCDQDDVWDETKLAVCLQYLVDSNLCLVVHSADVWNGQTRVGKRFPSYQETKVASPGEIDPFALTPGFAMVFQRGLLELTDNNDRPGCLFGLDNGSVMAHDAWIWLLGTCTGQVATLSEVLALYRQHGSNTVGAPKLRSLSRTMKLAAGAVNYQRLAAFEWKCTEVLSRLAKTASPRFMHERKRFTEQWSGLALMHAARAEMYNADASFYKRAKQFMAILASGGYSSGRSEGRLGSRAAFKDLSYGVSGLYKHFT